MRGLLCSTAFLLFSLSVFGSSDLVFRFITPVPSGDTDVADVEVSRIHGKNSVILDKTLEVFRSDYGFVYYNLFYPETVRSSLIKRGSGSPIVFALGMAGTEIVEVPAFVSAIKKNGLWRYSISLLWKKTHLE